MVLEASFLVRAGCWVACSITLENCEVLSSLRKKAEEVQSIGPGGGNDLIRLNPWLSGSIKMID